MLSKDATGIAGERLQRFLARAGLGSRRACEQLIVEGRVRVNDRVVTQLGVRISPEKDIVVVDGVPIKPEKPLYLVFNKPKNCLCTSRDDRGRITVLDFLPGISQRVYAVGRLDYDAEGLLILTNDGEFAQRVIHPKHGVARTYLVDVNGSFAPEAADALRQGVKLDGKLIQPVRLRVLTRGVRTSRLEIEVSQGINQQIKRMLRRVGYEVAAIKRTGIGKVELGGLSPGKFRRMTSSEIRSFEIAENGDR